MNHADAITDADLLRRYLRSRDEAALRDLMDRHLPFVYSVALRKSGSPELAAEVTQDVFIRLTALPAATMKKGTPLTAWLHRTASHRAIDCLRSENARKKREQLSDPPAGANAESLPTEALALLDDVIQQLPARDRDLVLQRFFLGRSLGTIGTQAGLSEDAVRMRLKRSLERMKASFQARGITTTTAILTGALPLQGMVKLPLPLAAAIELKVLSQAAVAVSKPAISSLIFFMTTTQKCITGASVLLLAGIAGTVAFAPSSSAPKPVESSTPTATPSTAPPSKPSSGLPTKTVREVPSDKDTFPELAAKYGDSRTRQAVNLAGRVVPVSRDLVDVHFSDDFAENRQVQLKSSIEELGKTLSLRPEQQQALAALMPEIDAKSKEQAAQLTELAEKNKGAIVETLLALDAWKQDEISEEEFNAIATRTRGELSVGHNSVIDALGIASFGMDFPDPLIDLPDLASKFESQLDPAQAEIYRQKRAKNEAVFTVHYGKTSLDDFASTLEGMKKMIEAQRLLKPDGQ